MCITIKLKHSNYFPIATDRFLSGRKIVNSCRAWTKNEHDFFNSNTTGTNNYNEPFNIIKNTLSETKLIGHDLYFKFSSKISNRLMEKVRRSYFNSLSSNNEEEIILPGLYIQPKLKNVPTIHKDNIISHNRDLIRNIIGIENASHFKRVNNYRKHFSGLDFQTLFSQKVKIINKFSEFLNRAKETYNFIYTESEIKYLRNLAAKYDAINSLTAENGIKTKELETLLFSDLKKSNIGDFLPNGDIIIDKPMIFNKQSGENEISILAFSNTNLGYRYKLYSSIDSLIKDKENLKKQFYYLLRTDNIDGINKLNNKIASVISNTEIAEVYIDIHTKSKMKEVMRQENTLSDDIIDNALSNGSKFCYLHNLQNLNPQKYHNVSRILITALKRFCEANNINTAFMEALSFGKIKHSPIALYLRVGCIPLSDTKENIENQICKNPSGYDYKKNIWLKYNIHGRINT